MTKGVPFVPLNSNLDKSDIIDKIEFAYFQYHKYKLWSGVYYT